MPKDLDDERCGLAVADELAVSRPLLRPEVIAQHLVEALQANSISVFLFVFANLRSAPDTFHEVNVFSFNWYLTHRCPPFQTGLLCRPQVTCRLIPVRA